MRRLRLKKTVETFVCQPRQLIVVIAQTYHQLITKWEEKLCLIIQERSKLVHVRRLTKSNNFFGFSPQKGEIIPVIWSEK